MTALEKEKSDFDGCRTEYRKWVEEDTTVNQRIVSVRIEASYLLKDWVQTGEIKSQEECYKAYLRLVDAWFTYEALLTWAAEENVATQSGAKTEKLLKNRFPTRLMADVVFDFYDQLSQVMDKPNRKKSFEQYVNTLANYPGTSQTQKQHLEDLKSEIITGNLAGQNYSRILAFAYAIRNAYAHNGETAKSGTNHYVSKLIVLNAAYAFVLRLVLRASAEIYDDLTAHIS